MHKKIRGDAENPSSEIVDKLFDNNELFSLCLKYNDSSLIHEDSTQITAIF